MKKILLTLIAFLFIPSLSFAATTPTTMPATNIESTQAKLHGNVSFAGEGGASATIIDPVFYFEYGATDSFGFETETSTMAGDPPNPDKSALITNLTPNATYHFRFVKKTGNTTNGGVFNYQYGETLTFTTAPKISNDDGIAPQSNNNLTQAQISGLSSLGFTQTQIDMIVALFANNPPTSIPLCGYGHTSTLRQGSFGSQVVALQRSLGLVADGKFGPNTARAVKEYQVRMNLTADGIVGSGTGSSLRLNCYVI